MACCCRRPPRRRRSSAAGATAARGCHLCCAAAHAASPCLPTPAPIPLPPPTPRTLRARPLRSLLWFFCLSWVHKVLMTGFICLHLKAQGHISPTTEMQARIVTCIGACIGACIGTPPYDRDPNSSRLSPSRPRLSLSPPPARALPIRWVRRSSRSRSRPRSTRAACRLRCAGRASHPCPRTSERRALLL